MKIILMDDIPTLGRRGEVHDVSDGYARNFLLPQKLALHATPANRPSPSFAISREGASKLRIAATESGSLYHLPEKDIPLPDMALVNRNSVRRTVRSFALHH